MRKHEPARWQQPRPMQLWNIQQTAEYLGVPVSTLYYWSYRGDGGPPILRIGRCLRYEPNAVIAWAKAGGH